jgi:hemin uptake protein HemP
MTVLKPTKSNLAWPAPPSSRVTSTSITGPDRIVADRQPYRRVSEKTGDPLLGSQSRVIIAHTGKSFAAPPL